MVYETERLLIRKLKETDINPFHEMQSNKNVMIYTDSPAKTYEENVLDLDNVISHYSKKANKFWVWAVIRKNDNQFIGTIALIEDDKIFDEVGFRYLEKYWNNGYGYEALKGLMKYARKKNNKNLMAEVYAKNKGSEIILRKAGFTFVKEYICKESNLIDKLYQFEI